MTDRRVWIELDRPDGMTDAEAEANCEAANRMLRRLYQPEHVKRASEFWWNGSKRRYCVTLGGAGGGFLECSDSGHWFNLDYFGRADEQDDYGNPRPR